MPEVWSGRLGEFRAISTAGGGTALTNSLTAASFIQFPALTNPWEKKKGHLMITPRNLSTAVVVQLSLNPWLVVLKTTDGMGSAPTDYSIAAQDGSTGTSVDISSLDTVANGDWLLLGSHLQYRGFYCDMDGTNGSGTAAASVHYYRGGWVDTSATVSGITNTRAFDQDGIVTWTIPSDWGKVKFSNIYPESVKWGALYYRDLPLYWTRVSVSAALDSSTTMFALTSANRSATKGELLTGQTLEQLIEYGFGGLGCIEAVMDAGTGNLIANVATAKEGEF